MKKILVFIAAIFALLSCADKPSALEQHRVQKHINDSIALVDQERSLTYYQSQLDALMPTADSLIALFKYEKNEKYQDHGYYVATSRSGLRIMVRDDAQGDILIYREGKRIDSTQDPLFGQAQHLQIVIRDIRELEHRIAKTSLEVQKYQKRLQKE